MKISELIQIIQAVQKTHGELPVLIGDDILDPVDAGEPHRVKEHVSQKYVCGYPLVDWG